MEQDALFVKYDSPDAFSIPYDSPIEVDFIGKAINEITTKIAEETDTAVYSAILKASFNVDRDKMVAALTQDKRRYEEAYSKGHRKGFEDRENQIVRCKDCINGKPDNDDYLGIVWCRVHERRFIEEWYCADAQRREEGEEDD